ncbi:restriction endonuclease subunit S [Priestia megaterium]
MTFKNVKLSDIATVQTGPFGSQLHKEDYVDNGIPIITVEHLGENYIIHENLPGVSDIDYKRLSKYHLQTDDIVFSRVGSVDRRALVSEKENGWMFSGRCLRVRVIDKNQVNPKYLSYLFGMPTFKAYIRSIAVGATMPSINTKILSNIELTLPDLSTQNKIVEILYKLDTKIWINNDIINSLEELNNSIFKHWFINFDFPNEQGLPYKSNGGEMMESELGDIPKKWSVYRLDEFVESISNSIKKKEQPFAKFLNTSDILNGEVSDKELAKVSSMPGQAKKLIQKDDILYSEIRPKNKRHAYINFDADEYVVSTKLMVLRVNKEIYSSKVLYQWLASHQVISEFQQLAEDRSGTFPQITFSTIAHYKFAVPPSDIRQQLFEPLELILNQRLNIMEENKKLEELRDTLLPKLLSGEIEMPKELVVE